MFPVEQELYNRTVLITNPVFVGADVSTLLAKRRMDVVFGRIKRGDKLELVVGSTVFQHWDEVSIIGPPEDVDAAVREMGEPCADQLDLDRSAYDFRRVFLSHQELAGKKLSELDLPDRFGAIVTRVRRGDIELLAMGDLVLELGDRVRFVAPRNQMRAISDFFGDSYKALSEINLFSLGLGISLGLLLGAIPVPLPGGLTFKLGDAGGPLIVALVLSALRRTGPIVWSLPYSADLTIRQLGLIIPTCGNWHSVRIHLSHDPVGEWWATDTDRRCSRLVGDTLPGDFDCLQTFEDSFWRGDRNCCSCPHAAGCAGVCSQSG